jgi:hypothetical protein
MSNRVIVKPNKSTQYRLSDDEVRLLTYLRDTGTLPPDLVIGSCKNADKLVKEVNALRKREKLLLVELENAEKRIEILENLKSFTNKQDININPPDTKKDLSESIAIAVASDWHVEERVDPETVNYMNEFNPDIAKNRIRRFFEKVVFLTNISRGGTHIDTLLLALLGDVITGFIHEEHKESNFMTPLTAIRMVQNEIYQGIMYLLKHGGFKKIFIPCSYGNHGRTTQKIRSGTAADNSYEQHMYYTIRDMFKDNKQVEFCIDKSYLTYVTVFDKYVLRFHHGDAIRYEGGVGGLTIPANKAIAQWNKSRTAYLDIFGHYHQMLDGGKFVSNGSLIGYNPYAIRIKASYEEPKQVFFLMERDKGKTAVYPIFVSSEEEA